MRKRPEKTFSLFLAHLVLFDLLSSTISLPGTIYSEVRWFKPFLAYFQFLIVTKKLIKISLLMSLGIKSTENLKGLQDIKRIHEISEYFNLSGKMK